MFPKTQINAHTIIAAKDTVDIITQPYNNILGMAEGNSLVDSRYCYDNQTMGGNIRHIMKAAFKPTDHSSMNHMIAMVFSSLTSSPRFMGSDTEPTMGVNLTPFPALCLTTPAIVPLATPRSRALLTEYSITYDAFLSNHEMTNVDFLTVTGRYVSCVLLYRGNVQLKRVSDAIHEMRTNRQIMFVDWIPTGVKIERSTKRLMHDEDNQHFNNPMKSVLKVSNHTSLFSDVVTPILGNFSKLFSNRSYVHWYVSEGMTEGEFIEAEENLQAADSMYRALVEGVKEEEDGDN
jgi:tubulin alpha